MPKRSRDVLSGAEIAVEIQPCTTDQSVIVISDIEPALQKCSYMQADHTLRVNCCPLFLHLSVCSLQAILDDLGASNYPAILECVCV